MPTEHDRPLPLKKFASFVTVGALGFVIDGSILSLLVHLWGWPPYSARLLSFVPAVIATWYCNRRWVFVATNSPVREYMAYFSVQTAGALINLGAYMSIIAVMPAMGRLPIVPLACGAALALVFNYTAASRWVFALARSNPKQR